MPNPLSVADACDLCGQPVEGTAHYIMGKLLCEECQAGQRPAVSMLPTPQERQLLFEWIAPLNRGARP